MSDSGWESTPRYFPSQTSAYARPACSECGNRLLVWMPAGLLPTQVPGDDHDSAVRLLGYVHADDDAWLCERCFNFGVIER